MSAAIAAIPKLAAGKRTSIAHARPIVCPRPEGSNSPSGDGIREEEDDEAHCDQGPQDIFSSLGISTP
jgi:hypothetical protein